MPTNEDDLPDDPPARTSVPPPPPPPKSASADPTPTPAPKKHTHTQRLITLATSMGFSQADLDNHPSEVIWDEIDRMNRIAAARQASKTTAASPPPPPAPAEVDDVEEFLKNCEDEPTAKMIRALAKRAGGEQVKQLEAELKRIKERDEAREQNAAIEMVDDAFDSLGEQYVSIFGTGSIRDMKAGQDEAERRAVVFSRAGIDPSKMTARQVKAAIHAAAKKLYPIAAAGKPAAAAAEPESAAYPEPKKKTPPKDPINGRFTAEDFESGIVQRPSAKQTGISVLSADEGLRQVLRKHGDPRANAPTVEIDDDLPE